MSRIAVVVGVEQYQEFPRLQPAGDGATAIAQYLSRYGEYTVHKLKGEQGGEIGLGALESTLVKLFKPSQGKVPRTVFFYFSGYVWDKGGETALITSDVQGDTGIVGLSMSWLKRLLQDSRVPQWTIVLDGWPLPQDYSPNLEPNLNFAAGNPGAKPGYDRLFLAAAQPPNLSPIEGYSFLTQGILEGLDPYRFETGVITSGFLVNWLRLALEAKTLAPHFQESGRPIILTRSPDEVCPYKGLSFFDCDTEDPKHFFGREALTEELLEHVQRDPLVAIVGASGCGKSSVLRAGLIHHLREGQQIPGSDTWEIRLLQPGNHPLLNLAFAFLDLSLPLVDRAKQLGEIEMFLSQGATGMRRLVQVVGARRLIIAVDQFEEMFTLCQDRAERQTFLDCLLGTLHQESVPLQVVLTLRSDFLAVCSRPEYGELGNQIRRYQVEVPPMSPVELRQAIAEPALRMGVPIEAELVDQLIHDVAGAPGSLPLLEHTLAELWKQRTEAGLKTRQYVRWGGIRGSLQSRANAVFHQLSPEQKRAAQHIFLSLTQFGDGITEDSRRRVFKQDLVTAEFPQELIDSVLQRLTDEKLVVTSQWAPPGTGLGEEMVVDVIHESLVRHWDLLRQWVNENRTVLRQQRSLEERAQQWFRKGKSEDYLIQGRPLEEALRFWQAPPTTAASRLTQEFLQASQAYAQSQAQQQQAQEQRIEVQVQRVKRADKRLWATIALGGITLLGASVALGLQFRTSEVERIQNLKPAAQGGNSGIETRLASVTAADQFRHSFWAKLFPDRQLEQQVLENLQQSRYGVLEINRLVGHAGAVLSVAISPDGNKIITAGRDGTAKLWNWDGTVLVTFKGHQGPVTFVTFSRDGQVVATAGEDGTVRLWDLNGQQRLKLNVKTTPASSKNTDAPIVTLDVSPNQREFATGGVDGMVRRWDWGGNSLSTFAAHNGAIYSLAYSPDGTELGTAGGDGLGRVWSLAGQSVATLTGHEAIVSTIAFSPDRQTIATGDFNGQVRIWTASGELRRTFVAHNGGNGQNRILGMAFSPDSQLLGTSGTDGTARLWNLEGRKLQEFKGHQDWIYGLAFNPDQTRLVTAGRDGTGRIWDLTTHPQRTIFAHPDRILTIATSPLRGQVATGSTNGSIYLWSVEGQPLATLQGHRGWVLSLDYAPNGDTLASSGSDGTIQLWRVSDGKRQRIQVIPTGQGWVYEVHFSPDGQRLVSRGRDGTIKLWDLQGKLLTQFTGHQGAIYAVKFSPNGQMLATRGRDSTVRLWDLNGKPLAGLRNHQGEIYDMAFLPSGDEVVTAGADGTVRFWSLNAQPLTVLKQHQGEVYSVALSPDGQYIATGSADRTVRLWDTAGNLLKTLSGHQDAVWDVQFSSDGQTLISRSNDGTVRLWTLDGTPISTLRGDAGTIQTVKFSGGSDRLVTTSSDGQLRFWNRDAKLLRQWQDPKGVIYRVAADPKGELVATGGADGVARLWKTAPDAAAQPVAILEGHQGPIWQIIFSPQGDRLVTTSADGTVRLWDRQGKLQSTFTYPQGETYSITFSPNGQEFATASSDGVIRRWSLTAKDANSAPIVTIKAHQGPAYSVAYSPQGDRLVSGGADATVKLWKIDGTALKTLTGHQDQIFDVSFNATGDRIASASGDGTARLWDTEGHLLGELRGHESPVWRVIFTPPNAPEGEQILTSGADGTTRLWSRSGQLVSTIVSHSLGTYDSVFSTDGKTVFSGGLDGQLRFWTIAPLETLLKENCQQLAPYFSNPQINTDQSICQK